MKGAVVPKIAGIGDSLSRQDVAQELDSRGLMTGIEAEIIADEDVESGPTDDGEAIVEPFDPERIDVVTRNPTVDLLLSRIRNERIDLEPEFQRHRGIWTLGARSRLIESLLLRIPLPTLYAAEDEDENWTIVDGIQRLSTITEFIEPTSLGAEPLVLQGLEYLTIYNGARFADLSPRLQTRLREAELVVHLIRLGTPEPVKFNIFARINTGGKPLSAQELRHALIAGPARQYLKEWAGSDRFARATGGSIRAERMDDREMVLRFVAFRLTDPEQYSSKEFDEFLRTAMRQLNELPDDDVGVLRDDFFAALDTAAAVFDGYAFRKRSRAAPRRYNPVNKALFETVTVSLAGMSEAQRRLLTDRRERVVNDVFDIMEDESFVAAISAGTGQVARVRHRFRRVRELFEGGVT